jgi:hypothetical protein
VELEGEIGDAAGMIWQYLNEHGQTILDRLRQGTKLSDQLLLMGVGWLGREGKVSIVQAGSHGEGLVARRLTADADTGADHRGSHLQFGRERDPGYAGQAIE